jgi:peptidoglycan/LPS O-acetylase OafA/YrhL
VELLKDGRIAVFDGLRGIAIVMVVWLHVWGISWQSVVIPGINFSLQPIPEAGFIGVPLFFFISGFVLLLPFAHARLTGRTPPSWKHFYLRRGLKIVPSYVLCMIVLIAFGFQTYASWHEALRDVAFHLLFIHNWFAATYESITVPMWSLGVEIQFYVLFPLIALAFLRMPLVTALGMVAVANGWRIWCLLSNHYFFEQRLAQLPAHLDFFAAGMLCAFAYVWIAVKRPALGERKLWFSALMLAGFLGFWLLLSDCYAHRYDNEWAQPWNVEHRTLLALAFLAMGLGALFAARLLQRVLGNPLLIFLAAISYNLYLWHLPIVLELRKHHIPPYATADPHDDKGWMLAFQFVALPLALAAAALVTYGFEQPILRLGKRRRETRPTAMPIAPETLAET